VSANGDVKPLVFGVSGVDPNRSIFPDPTKSFPDRRI
jgi:hypothetical protein